MGYRTLLKAMLLACVCVAQHGRSAELVIPGSGDFDRETTRTGAAREFLTFVASPAAREVLGSLGIAPATRK